MPQHDYVIDDADGQTFLNDVNAMAQAIVSNNSGGSAPSTTYGNMFWAKPGANLFKKRVDNNNDWKNIGISDAAGFGLLSAPQCRLEFTSSTVLTLTPREGNLMVVYNTGDNGWHPARIRASFPTWGTAGLTGNTLYYAYLKYDGSYSTLLSTTGYIYDNDTGIPYKSDNINWVLVGLVRTNAAAQFQDNLVASYYVRRRKQFTFALSVSLAASLGTWHELSAGFRAPFVAWGDDVPSIKIVGTNQYEGTSVNASTSIGIDSNTPTGSAQSNWLMGTANVSNFAFNCSVEIPVSEGFHEARMLVAGAGGSWLGGSFTESEPATVLNIGFNG